MRPPLLFTHSCSFSAFGLRFAFYDRRSREAKREFRFRPKLSVAINALRVDVCVECPSRAHPTRTLAPESEIFWVGNRIEKRGT